jgi:3-dehydroquinate synthase class II
MQHALAHAPAVRPPLTRSVRRRALRCGAHASLTAREKEVYVRSGDAGVLQAARAAGFALLGTRGDGDAPADAALLLDERDVLTNAAGDAVGRRVVIADAAAAAAVALLAGAGHERVLVEPTSGCWAIIPAENLVAAFASSPTRLLLLASSADDARLFLGALQAGVDGVVLHTERREDVEALSAHLRRSSALPAGVQLAPACITRVVPLGCVPCWCAGQQASMH